MNIPKVIAALVRAQNNFDCVSYANFFSETAPWLLTRVIHIGGEKKLKI